MFFSTNTVTILQNVLAIVEIEKCFRNNYITAHFEKKMSHCNVLYVPVYVLGDVLYL